MPNHFFQFKHFTVQQDKCAMKVCTDACLFGAYVSGRLKAEGGRCKEEEAKLMAESLKLSAHNSQLTTHSFLDIGAGTGLLSLMLAQNTNATIDAVEIDERAVMRAKENFEASPWSDRLQVHHSTIQLYNPTKKYDFIISNPPFFQDDLKSNNAQRNLALHSDALSLEELISHIKRLLKDDGNFAVLLPYHRSGYFENLAIENGFKLAEKVLVTQTPAHHYFRSMLMFSKISRTLLQSEIFIKNQEGNYSPAFIHLLKDYYLYL